MVWSERGIQLLSEKKRFVLTTHLSADGDGVGSQLALARGLKRAGREAIIINPTPLPENLKFLLRQGDEISVLGDIQDPWPHFSGAVGVILDMGAPDRLAGVLSLIRRCDSVLVIDHHPMDLEPGMEYLLDTSASSTGEVTLKILDQLGVPLSLDLAEPIYVAIYTDTGGFRYPGTTPQTHRLAARLLETGVDPQRSYTELFERLSQTRLRLTGEILSTMRLSPSGKVASMVLTQNTLDKTGARIEDGDDLVNYTLLVDGVLAGFYFKELGMDLTKVSCRSRGSFAINEFVGRWGGGGHAHAAGLRLEMSIAAAQNLILNEAESAVAGFSL
jgi:bifunctional oligoribonuclease and PAP phosphatase NrnA